MLQVATTTTCCKSLKEILNTEMILSLQQRTNYINNYFINKNEKDVCTVCVPVFVHTCTHPVQKQNKPNKMKYVCFSSTAVHSVCNEFEKLCWGHPEIIQLILGVNILDRAEQTERRASAKKKNNGKKELDIENANRLEVLLDDIDRMEVLQLINLAHENNVELIKDQSSEVLRQRLKRVMVDRVV